MGCNCQDPNCQPCGPCGEGVDCPPVPDPVLPPCSNTLPDGTYTNATITVSNGCISNVTPGTPLQYSPLIDCCGGGGGGSGSPGPPGPPGPPGSDGQDAQVYVGNVTQTPEGTLPTVTDVNADPNVAVLDFTFPAPGTGGGGGGGTTGVTHTSTGFKIEDGLIKLIPNKWPPVVDFLFHTTPTSVSMTASIDITTGQAVVFLDMSQTITDLHTYTDDAVTTLQNTMQAQIDNLQAQIDAINTQLATCCP